VTGQATQAVAIGFNAGSVVQAASSVAIGPYAGQTAQATLAVAIGNEAGAFTQATRAVAIGYQAGKGAQAAGGVAIGAGAALLAQGANAITIGNLSCSTQTAGSIQLNASGANVEPTQAGFYVNPIRSVGLGVGLETLTYSSGEVVINSTKTFVIQHPLQPEQYLVHGCLEGPESGVFYRGTAVVESGAQSARVALPAYVTSLADNFTMSVSRVLTEESGCGAVAGAVAASRVDAQGCFWVYGPAGEYDWVVHGRRAILEVEVPKASATLCGSGPYTYLQPGC